MITDIKDTLMEIGKRLNEVELELNSISRIKCESRAIEIFVDKVKELDIKTQDVIDSLVSFYEHNYGAFV